MYVILDSSHLSLWLSLISYAFEALQMKLTSSEDTVSRAHMQIPSG